VADRKRATARSMDSEEVVDGAGAQRLPAAAAGSMALDGLIHERVRLGNLSAHARKLEDAGYIRCRKSFAGRVPRTDYELTALGRSRLGEYVEHMEALIRMTRES
jgi:hypothetical protein